MSNAKGEEGRVCIASAREVFLCYDSLPLSIRLALSESTVNWDAIGCAKALFGMLKAGHSLQRAETYILDILSRMEQEEVSGFSEFYTKQHGAPLPHVAADASILRYNSAVKRRLAYVDQS